MIKTPSRPQADFEHDPSLLQHAGLLVLHAHAENAVEAFGRMFHGAARPPLMKTGKMEHRLVMHHLLVHADNAAAEGGYAK